ncbi:hypothetical protein EYF80_027655 [Liparis tanakae]|uniref:Uncharacterized protein n=1 Tax=Liparis tanakae TaxID=230148 RepID=A0A4Z2HA72_9TELE|nr:hypothetical protein EYF80_027655 [Liparis tanakae]
MRVIVEKDPPPDTSLSGRSVLREAELAGTLKMSSRSPEVWAAVGVFPRSTCRKEKDGEKLGKFSPGKSR